MSARKRKCAVMYVTCVGPDGEVASPKTQMRCLECGLRRRHPELKVRDIRKPGALSALLCQEVEVAHRLISVP